MFEKYFISAYASSRTLSTWDEEAETFLFQGLAEHPLVKGIEIPIAFLPLILNVLLLGI